MNKNIGYKAELPSDNIYESNCPIIYALNVVEKNGKCLLCGAYLKMKLLDITN